jgi:putative transposase
LVVATDRQYNIWLRDPLAIKIFNLQMLVQKLDYMHLNPLQPHWLLCNHPAAYQFSSAVFYEQQMDEFKILTNFGEVF